MCEARAIIVRTSFHGHWTIGHWTFFLEQPHTRLGYLWKVIGPRGIRSMPLPPKIADNESMHMVNDQSSLMLFACSAPLWIFTRNLMLWLFSHTCCHEYPDKFPAKQSSWQRQILWWSIRHVWESLEETMIPQTVKRNQTSICTSLVCMGWSGTYYTAMIIHLCGACYLGSNAHPLTWASTKPQWPTCLD